MPRCLTAFVGRLHFDTSTDDLSEFMEAAGVINPTCKRLEAKNGRQFKTAAFMVSLRRWLEGHLLRPTSRFLPEGCELRDWIFYGKKKTEDSTDMKKGDINKSDTHSDYGVKSSD